MVLGRHVPVATRRLAASPCTTSVFDVLSPTGEGLDLRIVCDLRHGGQKRIMNVTVTIDGNSLQFFSQGRLGDWRRMVSG